MKKIVRLTENDLVRLVKRVIGEQVSPLKEYDRIKVMIPNETEDILTFMVTDVFDGKITILGADEEASRHGFVDSRKFSFDPKSLTINQVGKIISINDKPTINAKVSAPKPKAKPKVPAKINPASLIRVYNTKTNKVELEIQESTIKVKKVGDSAPNKHGAREPIGLIEALDSKGKKVSLYFRCNGSYTKINRIIKEGDTVGVNGIFDLTGNKDFLNPICGVG